MRCDEKKLIEFVTPYYVDKDIMHNMRHIELVKKKIDNILDISNYKINYEYLIIAMYFHGFIYSDEKAIRTWLNNQGYAKSEIDIITKIAWESQRSEVPESIEGKILHDAHVLEGGKTFTVVKTLITGTVRGQTLEETLEFMKNNVLNASKCYLPETVPLCDEINDYTNQFFKDIIEEL